MNPERCPALVGLSCACLFAASFQSVEEPYQLTGSNLVPGLIITVSLAKQHHALEVSLFIGNCFVHKLAKRAEQFPFLSTTG
jgi:hypothetical protein